MGSCAYPVKNVRDLTTVEAYACLKGVVFLEEMGFGEVIVEGDSITAIKRLRSPENDRSLIGVIINKIKEKTRIFRSIEFRYISLGANEVAHAVAAWRRGCNSSTFWMEETPSEDLRGTQRLEELGEENDPRILSEEY
ncbi:hypothetical protein Golob_012950 [Gossypium lobatum]|uniref:RNase H type-1 domain-containing protein n=1 Tax=Gossypium lobatum TaxID=34289 RepID=A0A7J8LMY2_9ROSI|nr:hypothetical protein [Gossypium lobatum]